MPLRLTSFFKHFVVLSSLVTLSLAIDETLLKMALIAAYLNARVILVVTV